VTDLTTLNLEEFGEAAPYLQPAAEAVARAETAIATEVWLAGQALHYLHAKCQHGQWAKACEAIDIDVDRALRYRHVFERWPTRESLPDLRRELLITLAAPSVPESARQRVVEMAAKGDAPSVREAASIVDEERSKPSAPAEFNHDIDRTTQEPEDGRLTRKESRKLLIGIRRAAQKAVDAGVEWVAIRSMLEGLAGETGDDLVGLDDETMNSLLRQ
jgi:hypothetical protein